MCCDSAIISGGKTTTDQAANTCENSFPQILVKAKFGVDFFALGLKYTKFQMARGRGVAQKKATKTTGTEQLADGGGRGGGRGEQSPVD